MEIRIIGFIKSSSIETGNFNEQKNYIEGSALITSEQSKFPQEFNFQLPVTESVFNYLKNQTEPKIKITIETL